VWLKDGLVWPIVQINVTLNVTLGYLASSANVTLGIQRSDGNVTLGYLASSANVTLGFQRSDGNVTLPGQSPVGVTEEASLTV
jgi:hypothetical protein